MFHPLIKTLAIRPHLLIDHLGGYVDLLAVQSGEALREVRTRAILIVCMGLALLLGGIFCGVALLMLALMPLDRMAMPWLLLAVPIAPWVAAGVIAASLGTLSPARHFAPVREQLAADAALLKEAGDA